MVGHLENNSVQISSCGVVANVLDIGLYVREFELRSRYYVH